VIYNQTVQLVIFYLYLMFHACVQKFDVMEKECKNLEFGMHLNRALDGERESLNHRACRWPRYYEYFFADTQSLVYRCKHKESKFFSSEEACIPMQTQGE
jgi:hypothetical protein